MTNATVEIFVEELKKLNEDQSEHIEVGRGIDVVLYTGGDPRKLKAPYPFEWMEEEHGFSDLQALKASGEAPICQIFYVRSDSNT